MRFLNRLLVFLFVRRKAQAHARAVLDEKRQRAAARKPAGEAVQADTGSAGTAPPATTATDKTAAEIIAAMKESAAAATETASAPDTAVASPSSPREALIREALAARKQHEAEWDALTPAQQSQAIASLGEGMAAIVKTFRAA